MRQLASLPAYDLPELREAHAVLWCCIARALRGAGVPGVPDALEPFEELVAPALDPRLLFTQTCGGPLVRELAGRVRVLATPCYAAPGCEGSDYRSLVLVHGDSAFEGLEDLRGARCAVNDPGSYSGVHALRAEVAPLAREGRFFGEVQVTGSHLASVLRVRRGAADVAAIDCVTHALLARHRPLALRDTRVLCRTAPAPALPYVTRADADDALVEALRAALRAALSDPATAEARTSLLIDDVAIPPPSYGRIRQQDEMATARGYPTLQ